MTSAYSKSCGYKKFSVHTNTKKYRFQIVPLWRAFSKSSIFVDLFMRISVDGRRIRNNKVAFSNLSGIVWTRPDFTSAFTVKRQCPSLHSGSCQCWDSGFRSQQTYKRPVVSYQNKLSAIEILMEFANSENNTQSFLFNLRIIALTFV